MGPPPCRLRSGCPYGPLSFDPRRCPAQRVGIFHRPVQHASVSLRRRPEGLLLRAVPCPRHSRPAGGSQRLQPGVPVRCAAPSRRFSRLAAGSLHPPMQDRVLSGSSFRSYRHPPDRPCHRSPLASIVARRRPRPACRSIPRGRLGFACLWDDHAAGHLRRSRSRSPLPSSVSLHEGRVNGATIIKWLFCRRPQQNTAGSGRTVQ